MAPWAAAPAGREYSRSDILESMMGAVTACTQPETSSASMEDSQIIADFLRTSDEDLFELLVERYKDRVFRLVLSILGPACAAEAEEVTQEVFVIVYKQLETFRQESRFGTWIYRIAFNRAIDAKRRARSRHPHVPVEALQEFPDRSRPSPLTVAENAEQRQLVRSCMEQLPDLYRAVLYLHYWMECSIEEIGEFLGVPPGTVKSYLHRGRQRLYARMQKKSVVYGKRL
jgi:RNA polymerase sigma-70 factor, ECF subfamily